MGSRFELISSEELTVKNESGFDRHYFLNVFRDKQTGVMYVSEPGTGITPLVDKEGKPITTFKVSI